MSRTTPSFAELPLSLIYPDPDNERALGDVDELADSIRATGILQPLIVAPALKGDVTDPAGLIARMGPRGDSFTQDPEHGWGYVIVAGHRRRAAAELATLEVVPCVIRPDLKKPTDRRVARVIENLQRHDLTAMEEARAFGALVDADLTQVEIARRTGINQGTVSKRLALLKLPEAAQLLVDEGRLPVADAVDAARLPASVRAEAALAMANRQNGETPAQVLTRYRVAAAKATAMGAGIKAAKAAGYADTIALVGRAADWLGAHPDRAWDARPARGGPEGDTFADDDPLALGTPVAIPGLPFPVADGRGARAQAWPWLDVDADHLDPAHAVAVVAPVRNRDADTTDTTDPDAWAPMTLAIVLAEHLDLYRSHLRTPGDDRPASTLAPAGDPVRRDLDDVDDDDLGMMDEGDDNRAPEPTPPTAPADDAVDLAAIRERVEAEQTPDPDVEAARVAWADEVAARAELRRSIVARLAGTEAGHAYLDLVGSVEVLDPDLTETSILEDWQPRDVTDLLACTPPHTIPAAFPGDLATAELADRLLNAHGSGTGAGSPLIGWGCLPLAMALTVGEAALVAWRNWLDAAGVTAGVDLAEAGLGAEAFLAAAYAYMVTVQAGLAGIPVDHDLPLTRRLGELAERTAALWHARAVLAPFGAAWDLPDAGPLPDGAAAWVTSRHGPDAHAEGWVSADDLKQGRVDVDALRGALLGVRLDPDAGCGWWLEVDPLQLHAAYRRLTTPPDDDVDEPALGDLAGPDLTLVDDEEHDDVDDVQDAPETPETRADEVEEVPADPAPAGLGDPAGVADLVDQLTDARRRDLAKLVDAGLQGHPVGKLGDGGIPSPMANWLDDEHLATVDRDRDPALVTITPLGLQLAAHPGVAIEVPQDLIDATAARLRGDVLDDLAVGADALLDELERIAAGEPDPPPPLELAPSADPEAELTGLQRACLRNARELLAEGDEAAALEAVDSLGVDRALLALDPAQAPPTVVEVASDVDALVDVDPYEADPADPAGADAIRVELARLRDVTAREVDDAVGGDDAALDRMASAVGQLAKLVHVDHDLDDLEVLPSDERIRNLAEVLGHLRPLADELDAVCAATSTPDAANVPPVGGRAKCSAVGRTLSPEDYTVADGSPVCPDCGGPMTLTGQGKVRPHRKP